eukprot:TRINITY_DN5242_c0_g1_i10.p3 TRINITY_DN5242_c0_g1~~TRINITY_DN5242_c0_g1_i10.p3  ORF type:complete len:148 (-),score=51.34 TRINITY_DN5242_c0_g1_i10:597-1040(-)
MQDFNEEDKVRSQNRNDSSSNSEGSSSEGSDTEAAELKPSVEIKAEAERPKNCNVMIPEESEEDSQEESEEKDSSESSLDEIKPAAMNKPNIEVKCQTKKQPEKENKMKNEKQRTPLKGMVERPKTAAVHNDQLKPSRPQTAHRTIY